MPEVKPLTDIEFINGGGSARLNAHYNDDKTVKYFFEVTRNEETRKYNPVQYLELVMEWYYKQADEADSYGERIVCIINAESRIKRCIWTNGLDKKGYDFRHILDDLDTSRKRVEAYIKYEVPIRKKTGSRDDTTDNDFIKCTVDEYLERLHKERNAFNQNDYAHIVTALTQYFEGKKRKDGKPFFVSHGNKKRLGYALGCIYRGLRKESLSYQYLLFCRDLFVCFTDEQISEQSYLKSNLYKYFHSKTR